MATSRLRFALGAWLLALLAAPWGGAAAGSGADYRSVKTVDGMSVYFSVTSAESIRQHFRKHSAERKMHGGPPDVPHVHHIMVTVVDRSSDRRVADAHVTARLIVPARDLSSRRRPLEPMKIGDAVSYGSYVAMGVFGTYRVNVTVEIPGKPALHTSFLYDHEPAGHGR